MKLLVELVYRKQIEVEAPSPEEARDIAKKEMLEIMKTETIHPEEIETEEVSEI